MEYHFPLLFHTQDTNISYINPPNFFNIQVLIKIISEFTSVVNNGTDNGWTTIFDKFKNDIPIITDNFRTFASEYKNISSKKTTSSWVDYAKSIGNTDTELIKFLTDVDNNKRKISDIDDYMQAASTATSKFAATLKTVATNTAIMIAISAVIKTITWAWDELTTTVAEAKEEYDKLNFSIETLTNESDELQKRDYASLSQSERDRLAYLQDRIELEKELLKIQQRQQYQARIGTDWYNIFDSDSFKQQLLVAESDDTGDTWLQSSHTHNYEQALTTLESLKQKLNKLKDEGIDPSSIVYKSVEHQIQTMQDKLESARTILVNDADKFYQKMTEAQQNLEETREIITSDLLTGTDLTEAEKTEKRWLAQYELYESLYNQVQNTIHVSQNIIDSILERLGNNITEEELSSTFNSEELKILSNTQFDENATLTDLQNILKKAQSVANNNPIAFSIENHTEEIDAFQQEIETLSNALSKLKNNEFDSFDFYELIKQFPELENLENQADTLSTGIENLIDNSYNELLSGMGENIPTDILEMLRDMKEEAKNVTSSVSTIPQALNALQQSDQTVKDLQAHIAETGTITTDMILTLMNKYPQMTEVLNNYLLGLASQSDVINALQQVYATDLENYKILCLGKKIYDTDFYNSVLQKLPTWVVELAKSYGINLENFKNLAEAKATIEETLIKASGTAWASYYQHLQKAQDSSSEIESERQLKFAEKDIEKAQAYDNAANSILESLDDISIDVSEITTPSFDLNSGNLTSTTKETERAFDWTSNSITNLQNKIDELNTKLKNTDGWKEQLKVQRDIIKSQEKLQEGYSSQVQAYEDYYEEVSRGLTSKQKAMIESGDTFDVSTYGQKTYDKLTKAQSAYQDWQEAKKNVDATKTDIANSYEAIDQIFEELANAPLEKCTEKVEIFTKRIESLEKKLSSIKDFDDIDDIYNSQRKNYTKIYQEYLNAETKTKKNLTTATKELNTSLKKENKSTQKLIKEQIAQNKIIDISELKTEKAKIAATKYNNALEASKTAADNVKTALEDYTSYLQELSKSEIDRIINYYDNRTDINSSKQSRIQSQIGVTEAKGYVAGSKYYKQLIAFTNKEIDRLKSEKSRLIDQINTGNLSEDAYYNALQNLYSISDEIDKCKQNQIEWNNIIEELEWDKFDILMDKLESINKESDFMISLYDEDDLFDENGNITEDGLTIKALHAQNYNTYLAQSEQYAKEIEKINAKLASDPYNQLLIDRKEELTDAYQQAILSAEDEKDTILSLTEEAYAVQIDAMSELVDKKQELLDKEKELHDYQKSINDQSENIALLEKQINALSLSTDRADIAKRLQLEEELASAKSDLEEQQYQHSIETQKEALSNTLVDYEKKTDYYMGNEEQTFEAAMAEINARSSSILENLKEKAQSVGYTLSETLTAIWSDTTPVTNYTDTVIQSFTGIGNVIRENLSMLEDMFSFYEENAKEIVSDTREDYLSFPKRETATNSTADVNPSRIKELLGEASGNNGASNDGVSVLNKYLSKLGYAQMSKKNMVALAQALGLSDIDSVEKLEALETTKPIKDALNNYINSGAATVDTLSKTGNVSAANISNIISLIRNASTYEKDRSNLSPLNQYIYDNYSKKWLTESQMVSLAKYLGFSDVTDTDDITNSLKSKMLTRLKKAGFHNGGLVKAAGEDGIALVKNKEAILTKEQLTMLRDNIIPMNHILQNLQLNPMQNIPFSTQKMGGDLYITAPMVHVDGNLDNVTKSELEKIMETIPDRLLKQINQFGTKQ